MKLMLAISSRLLKCAFLVCFKFTPSRTGRHICSNDERVLQQSLPIRFGGLGIPLFYENAGTEF